MQVGDNVKARFRAQQLGSACTKWYSGRISFLREDGSADIVYDDGDEEAAVPLHFIKVITERRETFEGDRTLSPVKLANDVAGALVGDFEKTAPAPAAAARQVNQPALGKRKITPTMVTIDGYAVKKGNLYDLEHGERSVWDQELFKKGDEAFAPRDRPESLAKLPNKPAAPRKAREMSSEEKLRQERNAQLRCVKESSEGRCSLFLQPHSAVLRRFGASVPPTSETGPVSVENTSLVPPLQLSVPLRDYQVRGLQWLTMMHANGVNAILADEMGLGKTLQTIAFLAHLKFNLAISGPHLVVAPLSVLSSWMSELKRFCPLLRAVKLHSGDPEERKRLIQALSASPDNFDVVVTTYEMAKSPQVTNALSSRTWWRYLVVDEGHIIKNESSLISQALRKFHFAHALLLTGTPLQNNLHELWAILNFLHPTIFPTSTAPFFDSAFNLGSSVMQVDNEKLAAASTLLRPLMLRRTKNEVEKGLPPKLETTISCPLSEMQLFWYKRLLLRESALLKQLEADNAEQAATGADWKKLSSLLMQLRKCCNHPFLFPGVEPSSDETYEKQLVDGSGKFQVLSRLLAKLKENGHRVVLFSQFTSTLDLLEDFLNHNEYKYCRLDGSTNRVQRTVDINAFNLAGSKRFIFLMSTRAGGLGINCQTADTCILFDSDWNPQIDLQAMARVHRIGQTRMVHMYRLLAAGTVEERIVQRAEKKLYLDQMVNRGSTDQSEQLDQLSSSEMMGMLKFGAQCCFSSSEAPTDAELDTIIDRSRKESDSIGGIIGGTQHTAATFDAAAPLLQTRELQGASYGEGNARKPCDLKHLEGLLNDGSGGGTFADISDEWARVRNGKRAKKARLTTEWVTGVGEVSVLTENNYCMGEEMPNAVSRADGGQHKQGRQIAGRDFAHEDTCLACWGRVRSAFKKQKGTGQSGVSGSGHTGVSGSLRGCDFCPAAYHLECIGMSEEDAVSWGGWSCPHHSCSHCGRKAAAAGGLLFRCSVCPKAYCEDHLPGESLVMGECERFEALGFHHPKQGCYIQCSFKCMERAKDLGFNIGDGSAAAILGATGVDTTLKPKGKGKGKRANEQSQPELKTDTRSELEKLQPGVRLALEKLLAAKTTATLKKASAGFEQRVLSDETRTSTVDLLYDMCYDTDMFNTNVQKKKNAEVAARLSEWSGVERSGSGVSKGVSETDKEKAAALYLKIVRQLEGMKTDYMKPLSQLLGIKKLMREKNGGKLVLKNDFSHMGRKVLAPVIAMSLTLPSETALVIDMRGGRSYLTTSEMQGDPGFLVNGEPLVMQGARFKIHKGELVPSYQVPKVQPMEALHVAKRAMQLAKPQMSQPKPASSGSLGRTSLPQGWETRVSKTTGKTYYVNLQTNVSQWTLPVG